MCLTWPSGYFIHHCGMEDQVEEPLICSACELAAVPGSPLLNQVLYTVLSVTPALIE